MLNVTGLSVSYGAIRALDGVSLEIRTGEVVLLAGSNGAGKTTLIRAISGLLEPSAGDIRWNGESITGLSAHRIAAKGICHVPEGRRIWPSLTVEEHLQLAWHGRSATEQHRARERISLLFPRLAERWRQRAGSMSGGEQQMLAIARGLAANPSLLMIDELSLGLAPAIITQLFLTLKRVNEEGVTLLLVEQALSQALRIVDRGYVLETGQLVIAGTADELRHSEVVRKAYLSV